MSRMSNRSNFQTVVNAAHRNPSPIWKIFVGVICIAAFIIGAMFHIATSEAMLGNGQKIATVMNWGVLAQPYLIVTNGTDFKTGMIDVFGWFIEIVYLVCMTQIEQTIAHIGSHGRAIMKIFVAGIVLCVFVDFWSDFSYSNFTLGGWGQLGFAIVLSFGTFFFGIIGTFLVSEGLKDWTRA